MAGFMSGFGKTFGAGIVDAYDDTQDRKQDLFKTQYKTYLDSKSKYDQSLKDQTKVEKQARALAEQMGDPSAAAALFQHGMLFGSDAMVKVAEDRRVVKDTSVSSGQSSGMSAEQETDMALKDLVNETSKPVDPLTAPGRVGGLSQRSRQNVIRDLDATTRGDYSKVMDGEIKSPFAGADVGNYKILLPEKEIKAKDLDDLFETKRVQEAKGDMTAAADTQLQINTKILAMQLESSIDNPNRQPVTSYMEVNPTTGIANAVLGRASTTESGEKIFKTLRGDRVIPWSNIKELNSDQAKAVMSWYDDISTSEGYKKFQENSSVAGELFNLVGRMDTVAERFPDALNLGGATASTARGVLNNLRGILNVAKTEIDAMSDPKTKAEIDGALDQGIAFLELSDPNMDTAEARDILTSLSNLAAYKIAGTLEEGGRYSDPDIQRHLTSLRASTDISSFRNNLASLSSIVYQKLSQDEGSLAESVFNSAKGVMVYAGVNPGVDIRTIEERVQGDPYAERALSLIQNTRQIYEPSPGQPTGDFETPTEASKAKLLSDPSLRDAYEKRFGPGSADEVLGNSTNDGMTIPTD